MVRQLSSTLPNKTAPSSLTKATNPVETTHSNTKTQSAIPAMTKTMSSQDGVAAPYKLSVHQDFVQRMLPHAQRASRDSGIPAHLILGQAALESGWGKHAIKTADGSDSYNLFGIKAGNHWNGKVAEVTTTEYRNGVAFEMVDKFRVYSSHEEAFKDYTRLLSQNPRYATVLQQDNAQGFAQALQKSGYASDPRYAEKLTSVIGRINTVA
jgi:flagellar protein FlgJ